jgi:Nucleotidyl transferase AbiEii toxin, Type IV TA system
LANADTRIYLEFEVRRVLCRSCGQVKREHLALLADNPFYTKRFAFYLGDVVTPEPVHAVYPVLLEDLPSPRLRTYPVYTVIAEKLDAITLLGMTNTRMKDYLDIWMLLDRETLNAETLSESIAATFTRGEWRSRSVYLSA